MFKIYFERDTKCVPLCVGATGVPIVYYFNFFEDIFGDFLARPVDIIRPGPNVQEIHYSFRNVNGRELLDGTSQAASPTKGEWKDLQQRLEKLRTQARKALHTENQVIKYFSLPAHDQTEFFRRCHDPDSGKDRLIIIWGVGICNESGEVITGETIDDLCVTSTIALVTEPDDTKNKDSTSKTTPAIEPNATSCTSTASTDLKQKGRARKESWWGPALLVALLLLLTMIIIIFFWQNRQNSEAIEKANYAQGEKSGFSDELSGTESNSLPQSPMEQGRAGVVKNDGDLLHFPGNSNKGKQLRVDDSSESQEESDLPRADQVDKTTIPNQENKKGKTPFEQSSPDVKDNDTLSAHLNSNDRPKKTNSISPINSDQNPYLDQPVDLSDVRTETPDMEKDSSTGGNTGLSPEEKVYSHSDDDSNKSQRDGTPRDTDLYKRPKQADQQIMTQRNIPNGRRPRQVESSLEDDPRNTARQHETSDTGSAPSLPTIPDMDVVKQISFVLPLKTVWTKTDGQADVEEQWEGLLPPPLRRPVDKVTINTYTVTIIDKKGKLVVKNVGFKFPYEPKKN